MNEHRARRSSWAWLLAGALACAAVAGSLVALPGCRTDPLDQADAETSRLAARAAREDPAAADALIQHALLDDGGYLMNTGRAVMEWADENPRFFLASLDRRPEDQRRKLLGLLDFTLTDTASEARRRRFDAAAAQAPSSPSAALWRSKAFEP